MKRILLTILSIISLFSCFAQYGNEWIDYSKPYFKIKVSQEGIYRVNAAALNGVGLNFINEDNFILFRDGQEVPIYVEMNGGNVSFIEFYGYANDGKLDGELYDDPNGQLHDYYSLFSDEATYFLSFTDAGGNLRLNNTANDLTNLPSPEEYFYHTNKNVLTSAYSSGQTFYLGNDALTQATFDKGEGFYGGTGDQINNSTLSKTYSISTPFKFNSPSLDIKIKGAVVGWTQNGHHFTVEAEGVLLEEFEFSSYDIARINSLIPNSVLDNTANFTLTSIPTSSGTNRNTTSYLEVTYPREFQLGNSSLFSFAIEGNNTKQYLELQGVNDLGSMPVLYDLSNGYRIDAADVSGSAMYRFALPAALGDRNLIVFSESASNISTISSLSQTNFIDYSAIGQQGNYMMLSHPSLMGSSEFDEYAQYRSTLAGGGYQVAEIDIEQLYDQFAYGVPKHPLAVRRFVELALDSWIVEPKHLFIVGKGREYLAIRNNTAGQNQCLVPTFGNPGSDVLLASTQGSPVPQIAVGRIAAQDAATVGIYLEKVKQYEAELNAVGDPNQTVASKEFQKQIIHFGGGNDENEQNLFQIYLDGYKNLAEDTLWGANVFSVFKNSSNPLQQVQSDFIRERVENGVSLITFFGHSYAGGFDIAFDEPENYTNTGKYPIFLANGCYAGVIHDGVVGIGERFVFADQKASIAFISTSELSSSSSLNRFTKRFYNNFSKEYYNMTLGDVMKESIIDIEECCNNGELPFDMMIAHGMTLHGDPAIPINQYPAPDYAIEAQYVSFEPQNVTSSIDSFEMNLEVFNLGKAITDTFNVEVTRLFPDGTQEVYVSRHTAPFFLDTLVVKIPTLDSDQNGVGLNNFNIYIDVDDEISNELSETNNYLINQIDLFIGSDHIYPIFPFEFCIVPMQNVTLKASTGNAFASMTAYQFQIDTSALFVNPLDQITINSVGGVVEWQPSIVMQDDKVYYWRVAKVGSNNWQSSSFLYLDGAPAGWNQSHYYQYLQDDYENIYLDTDREFKYVDNLKEILIRSAVFPTIGYEDIEWEMDGAQQHNWSMNNCGGGVGYPNGITIALVNNNTGLPVKVFNTSTTSSYGPFGNIHCVGVPDERTVANFRASGTTPSSHPTPGIPWSNLIINYLNNVPQDYYAIVYTVNNPNYASWDANLVSFLNSKGSIVNNGTNGPMVLAYQETGGAIAPIVSTVGTSMTDVIEETFTITGNWNAGNIESTIIGPAKEWQTFEWAYHALENPTLDDQWVDVYGVSGTTETFLFDVPANTSSASLSGIDAAQYPYLKLVLNTIDEQTTTPAQLDYWRVIYSKPPEAAINPKKYFTVTSDTVQQGEIWKVAIAVENITGTHMDSLWTRFSSKYANTSVEDEYAKFDSLTAFDTLHLTFEKHTLDQKYVGRNTLLIEANPLNQNHQIEQHHFNNFAALDYHVLGDVENPLLDVTFDGIHILDGDIVSAKPEISILLKDENPFLALDDTSLVEVYIRNLNDGVLREVSFSQPNVAFYPANTSSLNEKNEARIVFQEEFPQDGVYELIVRSSDKSGNYSSSTEDRTLDLISYDYKISFEIINETRISNILNFPNPFTTQTQFIFTLTGAEIPDYFEIQIMNVKGTIIRQISQQEIGPIHIGLNKSEYWWDGRDQYGDLVANGVYFYRVKTSLDDEKIEHYSISQVDKFFKKGIGKMVFIR